MESALIIEAKSRCSTGNTHTTASSPQHLLPNSSSGDERLLDVIVLLKEQITAENGMHLEDWEAVKELASFW
jgi:hypothetical protein